MMRNEEIWNDMGSFFLSLLCMLSMSYSITHSWHTEDHPLILWEYPRLYFKSEFLKPSNFTFRSHGLVTQLPKSILFSGFISSIGKRNSLASAAHSLDSLYFCTSTSSSPQNLNDVILFILQRSSLKYLLAYLEHIFSSMISSVDGLSSSSIWAMWSSVLVKCFPCLGLNRYSPVSSSKIRQPRLQLSAEQPQAWPKRTSGERYWRVWISDVKWWL